MMWRSTTLLLVWLAIHAGSVMGNLRAGEVEDDRPNQDGAVDPADPIVELVRVTRDAESKVAYSMTLKLRNQGKRAITYIGYRTDSFDPPLKEPMCIYDLQYRKDGKWIAYPLGWCGFGMASHSLKPKGSKTVEAAFNEGMAKGWEAIRVGVAWSPPIDKEAPQDDSQPHRRVYSKPISPKDLAAAIGSEEKD